MGLQNAFYSLETQQIYFIAIGIVVFTVLVIIIKAKKQKTGKPQNNRVTFYFEGNKNRDLKKYYLNEEQYEFLEKYNKLSSQSREYLEKELLLHSKINRVPKNHDPYVFSENIYENEYYIDKKRVLLMLLFTRLDEKNRKEILKIMEEYKIEDLKNHFQRVNKRTI